MPTYDYRCLKCEKDFDVIESIRDHTLTHKCPTCGNQADRVIKFKGYFIGTKVEDAEYNPAFGKVIRGKRHRQEEAKARGWIEVGNEPVEKIHKHYDDMRERKRQRRWEED